jgi:hypothetical protein
MARLRLPRRALALAASAALLLPLLVVVPASAATAGTWFAYPGNVATYETAVQQPINLDGSSNFKSNGNAVIPVKFGLSAGSGPFVFESIFSDTSADNDYSFLSFTPAAPLTFAELTELSANYLFTLGNCGGGALRWSVRVSSTQSVFIYYGALPNFTDCEGANNQSNVNMIGMSDLRYDTSQVGGTFYDSYANALALVGSTPIIRASLVLDGGWTGDQRLTLSSATVNDNTFTPPAASPPVSTCDLPPAEIKVTKTSGTASGPVNDPVSIQPADNDGLFRIVDCKYMYNLATSSLSGIGRYEVEVVINGVPVPGVAFFDLR